MSSHIQRADLLIEALPYIQDFRGYTMVIKYGGSAMDDSSLVVSVLRDIVFLEAVGINPVVVHGGGKKISARMQEAGLKPTFVEGLRITDQQSVNLVDDVLNNTVNPGIVDEINRLGGRARSIVGQEVFRARKAPKVHIGDDEFDLGFVGELEGCKLRSVVDAVRDEVVPVISPLGKDEEGVTYNVNADLAASEAAVALGADKLIYLSDVNGVLRDPEDPESRIPTIKVSEIAELKEQGVISGGMIPKLESCASAIGMGIKKVHLIDGRIPHALLLELFTNQGIGTEIIPA
ncbi:MAG: acetylglutamate kinase [Verrucomicrobiota bacterium]